MPFGFRKSFKIAPGLRFNVSKRGVGISSGRRGMRVSASTNRKARFTASIPKTGLSYTTTLGGSSKKRRKVKAEQPSPASVNPTLLPLRTGAGPKYLLWAVIAIIVAGALRQLFR
jgi:hypothetical protein